MNGTATLAEFCTGTGSCPAARTQDCGALVCGATQCKGCLTDSECNLARFCRGGVCNAKATNGTACSRDGECASGHCVDGVCCNDDCIGQCQSCNDPSSVGTCIAISGAPQGNRPACNGTGSLCGGVCDGQNGRVCTYPGFGVICHDPDCTNDVATLAVYCDGNGSCPAPEQQPCSSGSTCVGALCGGSPANCTTTCSTFGTFCAGGTCIPQKSNGAHCNSPTECSSSYCIDGVCCDKACSGQCEACDVSGSEGVCTAVTGTPHGSRQACASDGSPCAGSCDGTLRDRCKYPDNTQSCRTASCQNGVATLASGCQGDGSCGPLMQQDCGDNGCDLGNVMCGKGCRADADCTGGQFCSGGVCTAPLAQGSPCAENAQCATGQCVDHVCCDTACAGVCESCNQAGYQGTCRAVAGAPRGGRPGCPGSSACGGFCDGSNRTACALPGSSTECGIAFCRNGASSTPATCAGAICVPAESVTCDPFACDSAGQACLDTCTADTDCASGLTCSSTGSCEVPAPPDAGVDSGTDAASNGGSGGAARPDASAHSGGKGGTGGRGGAGGNAGRSAGGSSGTDAGASAPEDGGIPIDAAHAPDGGSHRRSAASGDTGGCGCRMVDAGQNRNVAFAGVAGALFVLMRRRQARPARSSLRATR